MLIAHIFYKSKWNPLTALLMSAILLLPAFTAEASSVKKDEPTYPDNLTSIGNRVFENCGSLAEINVDPGNKYYCSEHGILYAIDETGNKTGLICCPAKKSGTVNIPDSITWIEEYAFSDCGELTKLIIPNNVESISFRAFEGCTNLTIYGKANSYAQTYAREHRM